jgi:hypothetical protein
MTSPSRCGTNAATWQFTKGGAVTASVMADPGAQFGVADPPRCPVCGRRMRRAQPSERVFECCACGVVQFGERDADTSD